jgi:hypothetical protein
MNRDELTARGIASPPAVFSQDGVATIHPRDGEGGTWIGANGWGIALALLNWNDAHILQEKSGTRGCVIPALIGSESSRTAESALQQLNLQGILPFRLVGFFPAEELVMEWRWNQRCGKNESHPWIMHQWCSSSLSDAKASAKRQIALRHALRESDAKTPSWLRRLHASHLQEHDPFSICVHREHVQTMSYTELICAPEHLDCNYVSGSPCGADNEVYCVWIKRQPLPEDSENPIALNNCQRSL